MNVPKLRFKEFTEDYIKSKINDRGYFFYGKSAPKWSLSDDANIPCVRYGELYTTYGRIITSTASKTNIDKKNLVFSDGNQVLIPRVGEDPLDFCKCSYLSIPNVAIGEMISVYNPIDNPLYISYYFNSKMKYQFAKMVEGISISNLYYEYLKNIKTNIPPTVNEQKKIADFLYLLDKKIELQSKKIEALKLYKLSNTNNFFVHTNNLVPLGKIAIIEKGKQINLEKILKKGNYYMLNGGIMPSGYLNDYNTLENTITISEGGNSCGYVNFNKEKFWCGGHCYTIKPIDINNNYLFQLLKYNEKKIMRLRVGSGLPNIQKKDLEKFNVKIHDVKYQDIISKILFSYDYKIDLEMNKLNKLQKLKKGLMQNMFV